MSPGGGGGGGKGGGGMLGSKGIGSGGSVSGDPVGSLGALRGSVVIPAPPGVPDTGPPVPFPATSKSFVRQNTSTAEIDLSIVIPSKKLTCHLLISA